METATGPVQISASSLQPSTICPFLRHTCRFKGGRRFAHPILLVVYTRAGGAALESLFLASAMGGVCCRRPSKYSKTLWADRGRILGEAVGRSQQRVEPTAKAAGRHKRWPPRAPKALFSCKANYRFRVHELAKSLASVFTRCTRSGPDCFASLLVCLLRLVAEGW